MLVINSSDSLRFDNFDNVNKPAMCYVPNICRSYCYYLDPKQKLWTVQVTKLFCGQVYRLNVKKMSVCC